MYAHMPLYMWTCTHEYTLTLTHTHVQYDIELVSNDCALHPAGSGCLGVGEDQWAVGVCSLQDQMLWWLLAMPSISLDQLTSVHTVTVPYKSNPKYDIPHKAQYIAQMLELRNQGTYA